MALWGTCTQFVPTPGRCCKCFAPVRVEIVNMHARGVHGSRYKQSRTGFMHGYLQSSVLGNKFCTISSLKDTIAGYMHGVSGIFIQGMPCLSQLISHKVLSDVFLEHRNKNSYSNNAPCMYRTYLTYQNVFALTRFRYIVVLFHIFYHNWGKENRSLFWGLLEACFLGRIYTGEATLQCSLKWGKRTQGWTSMILKFINDSKLASGRNITNYNTMNEHDTERRVTNQNKLGGLQMSYIGLNNHCTWDSYDVTNTYKMSSI